jgi:hypothetical protein
VGDLPGWKRQSDQAIIDLFRHYGGGQAGGKRCPQGAFEQTLQLISPGPWTRLPRPTRHQSDGAAPRAPCSVQSRTATSRPMTAPRTSRLGARRRETGRSGGPRPRPPRLRPGSHRYSATRYRAKSARIADRSPSAIRLISVLSEEFSQAAAHSGDAAAPPPRMQTVAIGDIPYIPASPRTDRQPEMKLQSYFPSLGCEVAVEFWERYSLADFLNARPSPHAACSSNGKPRNVINQTSQSLP